jgi:hypothetical protein
MSEATETTTTEETTLLTDQGEQQSQETTTGDGQDSGDAQPKAPEKYEFKLEGFEIDAPVMERFEPVFRELDLTNEQATKLAEGYAQIRRQEADAWQAEVSGWADAVKSDAEIGGDKMPAMVSAANRVIGLYGTPELRAFFKDTGYGNHPELVRVFARIGNALPKEDTVVDGNPSGATRSIEERLYGNTKP